DRAELLLAQNLDRADLVKTESGQVYVLKGLLLVLKGLQKPGSDEKERAKFARGTEGQLKAMEDQLASASKGSLTAAQSAQQQLLGGMLQMVKGLVKAETGDEAQAKEAFSRALQLDPSVGLPSVGSTRAQALFEVAKASGRPVLDRNRAGS